MVKTTEELKKIEDWLESVNHSRYFKYNGTSPNGIVFTLENRLFSIIPYGVTEDKTKHTYAFSEWVKGAKENQSLGFTSCVSDNYVIITADKILHFMQLIFCEPRIYKWDKIKQLCEEKN